MSFFRIIFLRKSLWLCHMALPYVSDMWLCHMSLPNGSATWLCHMALSFCLAIWLCHRALPYGSGGFAISYAICLWHVALPHGSAKRLCHMALSYGLPICLCHTARFMKSLKLYQNEIQQTYFWPLLPSRAVFKHKSI